MEKTEDPLYVGVADPVGLRKDLLNSSKLIIGSLKKYEIFHVLREEKGKYVSDLKKSLREINMLTRRLKQMLPKTSIQPQPKLPEFEEEEAIQPRIIKEKTRLAELEDELAKIDERLKVME